MTAYCNLHGGTGKPLWEITLGEILDLVPGVLIPATKGDYATAPKRKHNKLPESFSNTSVKVEAVLLKKRP